MESDDPLFAPQEDSGTVLRPMPGGRRSRPPSTGVSSRRSVQPRLESSIKGVGSNPLINAATSLLSLVGQLRVSLTHPDIEGLRDYMVQRITEFDETTRVKGAQADFIPAARYVLCSLLDETVLSMPWGSESGWSRQSLLVTFHNEAWGGEKVFQILTRALKDPVRNSDLLEFVFVCLAFGFEGKYRVTDDGLTELERAKDNLFQTLRTHRGSFERDLSAHWKGVEDNRNALVRYVPLWVVACVAALLLIGTFLGFRFSLSEISYPVYSGLNDIGRGTVAAQPIPPPSPDRPRLAQLLKPEIKRDLVDVFETSGKETVRIRGDNLFGSGSASVDQQYVPLLARIAEAVDKVPGQVLIVGHTDNVAIRSLRFQSNWELSRKRAEDVVRVLAEHLGSKTRLKAEGRADTEPIEPNNNSRNRARNRRVEVTVLPPGAS